MERKEILEKLESQFKTDYAGNGYKDDFTPDGYLSECNFGGMLIIVGNSGESVLAWSDLADNAISAELTECEIVHEIDNDPDTADDDGLISGFYFNEAFYVMGEFMRIER